MRNNAIVNDLYNTMKDLPAEALKEVSYFMDFIRHKYQKKSSSKIIKLGGLLSDLNIDITDEDINSARKEMWQFGEIES